MGVQEGCVWEKRVEGKRVKNKPRIFLKKKGSTGFKKG